jgi:hypothetical protein
MERRGSGWEHVSVMMIDRFNRGSLGVSKTPDIDLPPIFKKIFLIDQRLPGTVEPLPPEWIQIQVL